MMKIKLPPKYHETRVGRTRHSLLFRLHDWQDKAAWKEFYQIYHNYVYAIARQQGLPHHDAEDLIQTIFRSMAQRIDEFEVRERRGAFRTWLARQVKWRAQDMIRRRTYEPVPVSEVYGDDGAYHLANLPGQDEDLKHYVDEQWEAQIMGAALDRMRRHANPAHVQIFLLKIENQWSSRQIAREMQLSVPNVLQIIVRMKRRFKEEVNALTAQLR